MRTWKYGISAAPAAPETAPVLLTGDICDCLRTAAQLGFDAIEYHTRENVEFDYAQIHRAMEETGCRISMIVTGRLFTEGGYSLTSEDPDNERTAVAGMLRYIDMAAELQAGLVLGWAKGNARNASSREAYFERLTKNLRTLDQAAAEKNVTIVIEAINHYEVDVFMTAKETAAYLREHDFRNCRVHLDTFHMMLEEVDYTQAILTAGDQLGYVHFADSTRWYPGSGYTDFKEIFRALDAVGYNGYLTIECFPHGNRLETAKKGLRYLKGVEAAVR